MHVLDEIGQSRRNRAAKLPIALDRKNALQTKWRIEDHNHGEAAMKDASVIRPY
ncbi:hypothetical protein [Pseudaminobacter salicylatoxidans]|uniref:hypothetical protein n=1 Tax=Pseudaminobacter salicylatoxidans TaxID=93369 RepID=UPI0002FC85A6|nr:hypothetical protein [Pseudaminobacter salicylatoxidans]